MNNMGLNYKGPLVCKLFSIANTVVLHNLWLVESMDTAELADMENFGCGGPILSFTRIFDYTKVGTPNTCIVQGSTVLEFPFLLIGFSYPVLFFCYCCCWIFFPLFVCILGILTFRQSYTLQIFPQSVFF